MAAFRCTYRLQLGPGLGFDEARGLVPYLRDFGVSHLYLSPSLQARAGSTHGCDAVDPTRISDDLGGEDAFRALCGAAGEAGLGVLLDIVPNHMATTEEENPFWRDPLWRAKFFDLDWRTGAHRRFFDVGELAGVRMEDPEVWETTHAKVIELAREGLIDGVRIDHPDGLANPRRYLVRRTLALRERRPAAFAGSYEPLEVGADTCAFLRGGEVLVAVAVRGQLGRLDPQGEWREMLQTPQLRLAERL